MKSKLYYSEIPLPPTDHSVVVIVCRDLNLVCAKLQSVFGKTKDYWAENLFDEGGTGRTPEGITTWISHPKLGKRIVTIMHDFNTRLVVHESIHVSWQLDDWVCFDFSQKNQEIQAYYVDYIVGKIMKMKKQ